MQPAQFRQADFLLVEINKARILESSREFGGGAWAPSWAAAGNRAYGQQPHTPLLFKSAFLISRIRDFFHDSNLYV